MFKAKYGPIYLILLVSVFALISCGSEPTTTVTSQDVADAFVSAGLEAEETRPLTKDDLGMAPMTMTEGTRFLIPSLCEDCGGRIMTFANTTDRDAVKTYYDELGRSSALFFSWVFVKDNILVQINGDLPEEQARQYESVLNSLD
jgi:hypothetical protein